MQRCASNVYLPCNNLQAHNGVHLLPLDWTSPAEQLAARMEQIRPDVVLACDVIFDVRLIRDLLGVIRLALATASECWIAGAVRNELTTRAFEEAAGGCTF
ncbi:hypothetical protein CALVIDRAFT_537068 [Calocera viscosa TUFC12733]|uniref:Uncharacterized protein n=1 Tax=Calocera viscosa (strain TUFC12733) TaxID=1330018 RepID=A0A167MHS8_CALVF|nr:hypothetical protein CALVIDRAFT_537068 [Calocera viscosa TUFC12733]